MPRPVWVCDFIAIKRRCARGILTVRIDERALCNGRENDIGRELCVKCKTQWLLDKIDE